MYNYSDKDCSKLEDTIILAVDKCNGFGDSGMKVQCKDGQASFEYFTSNDCSGNNSVVTLPPPGTCSTLEIEAGQLVSARYEC